MSLAWNDYYGNPTLHCPASAERFSAAEFVAYSPASAWSQETSLRNITRQWSRCTYDAAGNCIAIGCGTDRTTYKYAMSAICANGAMNVITA